MNKASPVVYIDWQELLLYVSVSAVVTCVGVGGGGWACAGGGGGRPSRAVRARWAGPAQAARGLRASPSQGWERRSCATSSRAGSPAGLSDWG